LPCQQVDVELQAFLQAYSLSGSRHFRCSVHSERKCPWRPKPQEGDLLQLGWQSVVVRRRSRPEANGITGSRRSSVSKHGIRRQHGGVSQVSQSHNRGQKPAFPRPP
jgi:hypothetical protein